MYFELILKFYLVENDDNIKHRNIPKKIQCSLSDIFRHEDVYLQISICFICFFECKQFLLVQGIILSESHFLYWKPFLLVEAILLSRYHSIQWQSFILVETDLFSGNPFTGTHFFLAEAKPFGRNHLFQWKPYKSFLLMEAIFQKQKPFLLVEAIPLSGGQSFKWNDLILCRIFFFATDFILTHLFPIHPFPNP